ncbi:MAG TPA: hypothetical protein VFJ19_00090 [Nocardioidaceae bacterium]|nr:hypothetical protein [Nocardioidaceae bacterium]
MLWVIVLIVVAGFVAWRFRVPIMAKMLGQSDARVRRALEQRKRR